MKLVPETEVIKMGKKAAKSRMIYGWKNDVSTPGAIADRQARGPRRGGSYAATV